MRLPFAAAAVVVSVLMPVVTPGAGDVGVVAEGTFESKGVSVPITGAYAFKTTSALGDDAIINVVVSNAVLTPDHASRYIDPWLDRRLFFSHRVESEEVAVINFELKPDGAFHGVSYQLGSGNGCGFCTSPEMKSTVKLAQGRLAGTLSNAGEELGWEITLDVPLASDEHGQALSADGGEPAKAYLAYAAALKAGDAAALKSLLVATMAEQLDKAEKAGRLEDFLGLLGEGRYVDSVTVQNGFVSGDTAVLVINGDGAVGKRAGEAVLRREEGSWRVQDEILEMAPE